MRLSAAVEHYRRQQQFALSAVRVARTAWSNGDLPLLVRRVAALQYQAAQDAAESVPLMLEEQGDPPAAAGIIVVSSLAGIASDGRSLLGLFGQAATRSALVTMAATQVQDAARVSAGVAIAARPEVTGYTRMLNPPSCERCVVLAGKFFRWNAGFERHPKCDCRHIPTTEDRQGDLTTDPNEYFDSLSREQQDDTFGKAAAQAIRDGADISQVVNSRRGMTVAGTTLEGTSRRGYYAYVRRAIDAGNGRQSSFRARRLARARLMPEQIYRIAGDDRAEALRLLEENGYISGSLQGLRFHDRPGSGGSPPRPPSQPPLGPPPGGERPSLDDLVPRRGDSDVAAAQIRAGLEQVIVGQYAGLHIDSVTVRLADEDDLYWDIDVLGPNGEFAGDIQRHAFRVGGELYVKHDWLVLTPEFRGQGFDTAFFEAMRQWYRESGVTAILVHAALQDGGFHWARKGFDWSDPEDLGDVADRLARAVHREDGTPEELAAAQAMLDRIFHDDPNGDSYPSPLEIANIGLRPGLTDWLGRRVMRGSSWHGTFQP